VLAGLDFGEGPLDAERSQIGPPLGQFFKAKGDRAVYVYDYGDFWEHEVVMKRAVTSKKSFERRLIAGALACPPEDCGGSPGYARMRDLVLTGLDPWDEDVEDELFAWLCGWHPEGFSLENVRNAFDR